MPAAPSQPRARNSPPRQPAQISCASILLPSDSELDPLRQRQLIRPVDGIGLPTHILLPRIAARFASATGILLAAERAADLRSAGPDVDIRDPAIAPAMAEERLRCEQARC